MSTIVACIIGIAIGMAIATAVIVCYSSCVVSGRCSDEEDFYDPEESELDIPLWEDKQ